MKTLNLFQIYKNESNKLNNMKSNYKIHAVKMYNAYIKKEFLEIIKKIEKKTNIIEYLIEINTYEHILKNIKSDKRNVQKNIFHKLEDIDLIKKMYIYKIKLLKKLINLILEQSIL